MVEFIYHGEVNVHQRSLSSFLKTAEVLRVSGLTQQQAEDTHNVNEFFNFKWAKTSCSCFFFLSLFFLHRFQLAQIQSLANAANAGAQIQQRYYKIYENFDIFVASTLLVRIKFVEIIKLNEDIKQKFVFVATIAELQ